MVERTTPYRTIGDLRPEAVGNLLPTGSPLTPGDVLAATPHAALALAQAAKETRYAQDDWSRQAMNPLGLTDYTGSRPVEVIGGVPFVIFPSYADAFWDYARRIVNNTVYPPAATLEEFLAVYVGGPDCLATQGGFCANGETWTPGGTEREGSINGYLYQTIRRLNLSLGSDGGTVPDLDPRRPHPWPPMVDLIVAKPYEGAGFDRCRPRAGRIQGLCTHITDGTGSIEFYRDFFSTGGERATDALVDLVLGRDGRLGLLNDWRDPDRGGTRAGWANGRTDGLEGAGVPFFRAFPAINEVLISVEDVARAGQEWTDAMLATKIELSVAIAQNETKTPWSTYPFKDGIDRELSHRDFATKSCPAEPWLSTYRPVVLREVKHRLELWQGGQVPPPPPPPPPAWEGPFGLPERFFAGEFGRLVKIPGGASLPFDPLGPISLAWLARCAEEGVFPKAQKWQVFDSTLAPGIEDWVSFANGWRLVREGGRSSWDWLDRKIKEVDG